MKTFILFLAATLTAANNCKAQERHKDASSIVLTGFLDRNSLRKPIDTIEVHFFNDYDYQLFERPTIYKAPLIDQQFNVRISCEQSGYMMIPGIRMYSFYANLHFVKAGDSLHIEGKGQNDFRFSGNAAERMNDQLRTGRELYLVERKHFSDIRDTDRINYQKERESELIRNYLDSLNVLSQFISSKESNALKILTSYSIKGMCLFEMTAFMDSAGSDYKNLLQKEVNKRLEEELKISDTEKNIKSSYFTYLFYLTDLNKALVKLDKENNGPSFEQGYQFITRHYSGKLRDKLLALYFGLHKTKAGMLQLLPEALQLVKEAKSKNRIREIANARVPGSPAYPFSFQDTTGKTVRLSDLKGKVILLDSWYKGCFNCAVLKTQMEKVIGHYKDNPNIIFIGLNVDKDKRRFIEGIKSGQYTAPEALNLYTNGLGPEHPMLTYYQYNGYPNLLLIDKKGKLISANPPRPATPEKTIALIELIDQHL